MEHCEQSCMSEYKLYTLLKIVMYLQEENTVEKVLREHCEQSCMFKYKLCILPSRL